MEANYLRMIKRMKSYGKKEWSVYILRCGDGSLYTGIAKNVTARLAQHCNGRGAAYTRSHQPVKLIYQEQKYTRSGALIREAQVKRLSRSLKEKLLDVTPAEAGVQSNVLDSGFRRNDSK
jgi:predicted GIY-YIG superfamily endonuclease